MVPISGEQNDSEKKKLYIPDIIKHRNERRRIENCKHKDMLDRENRAVFPPINVRQLFRILFQNWLLSRYDQIVHLYFGRQKVFRAYQRLILCMFLNNLTKLLWAGYQFCSEIYPLLRKRRK